MPLKQIFTDHVNFWHDLGIKLNRDQLCLLVSRLFKFMKFEQIKSRTTLTF